MRPPLLGSALGPFLASVFSLLALVSCVTPPEPPAPQPVVEPKAPEPEGVPAAPVEFQVSAEKKETTMAEIRVLVDKLNAIIAKKSFGEWRPYLDREYTRTYGDPVLLAEYSAKSPFLRQFNIKLKTLEDYFKYVVVPSRADTFVDDITFVDENRVNVWTVVDNERVLLYLLKLYDEGWKISSW